MGGSEENHLQDGMRDLQMVLEPSIGDGPCANTCTQSDGAIRDESSKLKNR